MATQPTNNAEKIDVLRELWHICANRVVLKYIERYNFQIQNSEKDTGLPLLSANSTCENLVERLHIVAEYTEFHKDWDELNAEFLQFYNEFSNAIRYFKFKAGRMTYPVLAMTWAVAERSSACNDIDPCLFEGVNPEVDRVFEKYMLMGDYL